MTRRDLELIFVGCLALLAGCVSSRATPEPTPEPVSGQRLASMLAEPLPDAQKLFRAEVEGDQGQGTLRLTLRTMASGDYQVEANDSFGRSLWTLRFESGSGLLIDHRAGTYCRYGARVPLPEASLEDLPLRSLPRILLGKAPVEVPPEAETLPSGAVEFLDSDGGRWRLRVLDGAVSSWTYYATGDRPLAWWSGERREAVLSHRAGTQLRWTETVSEPLVGGLPETPIGEGYVECSR